MRLLGVGHRVHRVFRRLRLHGHRRGIGVALQRRRLGVHREAGAFGAAAFALDARPFAFLARPFGA